MLGGLGRVGHGLRRQDHQQAVAVRVLGGDLQRLGVALGAGVAEDVDRIAVAPVRRQELRSAPAIVSADSSASSPPLASRASVASTPGPPALVTIGQPRAARARLLGQDLGHVEQVGDAVDAQHAAAAEGGVQHLVAAGQRAGVRRGGLGGGLGAARLDHDDRLASAPPRAPPKEGAGVADRLHVDQDALRVRVVAEVVDQVAPADVEHRADGDEGAEADLLAQAPVEDGGASAPLWLRKATLPGRAIAWAKVALKPLSGLITPRQFGPNRRIRPAPPAAPGSAAPVPGPRARLPEARRDRRWRPTPASTHSPITPGTVGAGVTITARSTARAPPRCRGRP